LYDNINQCCKQTKQHIRTRARNTYTQKGNNTRHTITLNSSTNNNKTKDLNKERQTEEKQRQHSNKTPNTQRKETVLANLCLVGDGREGSASQQANYTKHKALGANPGRHPQNVVFVGFH